jgi:hypothetical protein
LSHGKNYNLVTIRRERAYLKSVTPNRAFPEENERVSEVSGVGHGVKPFDTPQPQTETPQRVSEGRGGYLALDAGDGRTPFDSPEYRK